MRDKLGVLLMEDKDGQMGVQIFADPESLAESFAQLHGKVSDDPSRATFLSIDYKKGKVDVKVKDLPVKDPPRSEKPDGYVLGQGPVWFDKEEPKQ